MTPLTPTEKAEKQQAYCSTVASWREQLRLLLMDMAKSPLQGEEFSGIFLELNAASATLNNIRTSALDELAILRALESKANASTKTNDPNPESTRTGDDPSIPDLLDELAADESETQGGVQEDSEES